MTQPAEHLSQPASPAAGGDPRAHNKLRLGSSILYAVGGQFGYLLTQMIILAALARLRGPEAVGEFGVALALTTPFFMFANMAGKSSQASDVTQRYSFAEYAGLTAFSATVAAAASIATGLLLASGGALQIVVIVALAKIFEAVSNLAYGTYQQFGRVDRLAASLVFRGAVTVPAFVGMLLLGFSTGLAFTAQLLVWSMVALLVDYPRASRMASGRVVMPSARVVRLARLTRETAPLGASYLLNSLLVSLPRMAVERSLGLSAVGLLTVVNYFQQAGTVLAGSISQMLVNRFARLRHANAEHELRSSKLAIFALAAVCSVAGLGLAYFAGEWILRTFFGAAFGAAHELLVLVMVAVSAKLFSMVPHSQLHAERRFNFLLVRELATVIVCALLLAILVPRAGLLGAGYAIVGASLFRLAVMTAASLFRARGRVPAEALQPGLDAAGAS
ncbi:lipopolysaccharide biosynthesis protein [Sphingomonas sp.]|uniref:lipopolysaccharide biosynthesis protein n=1 Tax=Sphingomonas sp. TaxID=28214 RepID=UPI00286E1F1E|nr:lipopolysaccharide biosynthesis protein [Sphingomonas sp.]